MSSRKSKSEKQPQPQPDSPAAGDHLLVPLAFAQSLANLLQSIPLGGNLSPSRDKAVAMLGECKVVKAD